MSRYKYTSLKFVEKNIPEMREKKVSVKARSPGQFISQFRKAGGNPSKLPEKWQRKRDGFVARHKATYKKGQTRRRLALIAWGYNPD
jgi:hypothetical protein